MCCAPSVEAKVIVTERQRRGQEVSADEEFIYRKLIAAMKGLAAGMMFDDYVEEDVGRKFKIIRVLHDAQILQGSFTEDHVDLVKAAFAKRSLAYPRNHIGDCLKALLSSGT